jgi:glutamate 5-kinase
MHHLQAAAAVGQMGLAQAYESVFAQNKLHTAQILLTHADLADRTRYLNARSTLVTLLELGVVPIINENDTVVTDEIKFGDNDTLGALVANLIDADALIILTDQQGLYTADPRKDPTATLIGEDRAENTALEAMAGGAGSGISKGGMITKVRAAQRAARSGAHTCIASGREVDALLRVAAGNDIGTLLYATSTPRSPQTVVGRSPPARGEPDPRSGGDRCPAIRKEPAAHRRHCRGGRLRPGAVVACRGIDGREIARGLINYASNDTRRIARKPSAEIESTRFL